METNLTDEVMEQIRALNEMAADRGEALSTMALSWLLREEGVSADV